MANPQTTRFGRSFTSTPALPQSTGMATTGSSKATRFGKTRRFFGALRSKATTGGNVVKSSGRAAAAALAREFKTDLTVGGMAARQAAPAGATFVLGAINQTGMGKRFTEMTGDMVKPSTAATFLGMGLRFTGVDSKYLGRRFTHANTAMINGMLPVLAFQAGERAPEALRRAFAPEPSVAVKVSGVGEATPAPAAEKAAPEPEPVPGEASVS